MDHALKLGAFAAFNYKTEDFSQKVLKATKGKGVNVILDCVGASFWQQNAFVLAMEGRWVLYGLLGGELGRGGGRGSSLGAVFDSPKSSRGKNEDYFHFLTHPERKTGFSFLARRS